MGRVGTEPEACKAVRPLGELICLDLRRRTVGPRLLPPSIQRTGQIHRVLGSAGAEPVTLDG